MLPTTHGGFNQLHRLSELPFAMYHPLLVNRIVLLPLGPGFHLSATETLTIFWLTFATGVLALAGFRTNVALLLFTFGYAFLTAYKNSFGDFHQTEPVLLVTIGALALAPSSELVSGRMDRVAPFQKRKLDWSRIFERLRRLAVVIQPVVPGIGLFG